LRPAVGGPILPAVEVVRNVLLNWVLPVVLLMAVLIGVQWMRKPTVELGENGEAPGFVLLDTEGVEVSLEDFRGQHVIVNFWGTWCGPCKAELPILNRFARKNPDVVLLGLALDSGDVPELAEAKEELGIKFRVLEGTTKVKRQYGVSVVPTTFHVDPEGILRQSHVGVISPPRIASWVR
jgi:thiol-disulfide isomerase/thioredoxin